MGRILSSESFVPAGQSLYEKWRANDIEDNYPAGLPMILTLNLGIDKHLYFFNAPEFEKVEANTVDGIEKISFKDGTIISKLEFKLSDTGLCIPMTRYHFIPRPISSEVTILAGEKVNNYLIQKVLSATQEYPYI